MNVHGASFSFPNFQLLPDGPAVVIGVPRSFDLCSEIASADAIRLVTAFAHQSGWEKVAAAISGSSAKTVRLLAGTSFLQTEPKVLAEWLKLVSPGKLEAKLYHAETRITFHPKVLIVDGRRSFAIVGSGNLSQGGLHGNIECAVFVESTTLLAELRKWFDATFSSGPARLLTDPLVARYTRAWKTRRDVAPALDKQRQRVEDEYRAKDAAFMKRWDYAVSAAKKFLDSPGFKEAYKDREKGGGRIRQALRYPAFDFDKKGWTDFYSIMALGHLIAVRRDTIFTRKGRLQEGLRALVSQGGDVPTILNEFLSKNGRFHIAGLGLNTITKILAVHAPLEWAVYNGAMKKVLKEFGYIASRGGSRAGKFIYFAERMKEFKFASGLPDAYALDAFFYDEYARLKHP
jgi:HKD family nuclease